MSSELSTAQYARNSCLHATVIKVFGGPCMGCLCVSDAHGLYGTALCLRESKPYVPPPGATPFLISSVSILLSPRVPQGSMPASEESETARSVHSVL